MYTVEECRIAHSLVVEAVKDALKGSAFEVLSSKGTYGLKLEVKVALRRAGVEGIKQEREDWNRLCSLYGLTPKQYKAKFVHQGEEFTAFGFAINRRRFPLLARNAKGKVVLFTRQTMERIK